MNNPPCRVGHLFFPEINLSRSRKLLFGGNSRKGYSIILQMISGCNHLAYHQVRIGTMDDKPCRYCRAEGSEETAEHLLSDCDAFFTLRHRTLEDHSPPKPFDHLSARQLLSFCKEALIEWLPADDSEVV